MKERVILIRETTPENLKQATLYLSEPISKIILKISNQRVPTIHDKTHLCAFSLPKNNSKQIRYCGQVTQLQSMEYSPSVNTNN